MSHIPCEAYIRNRLLLSAQNPLGVHELGILKFSQTAQSARLREMARDEEGPQVIVHERQGKRYNTYTLSERGKTMAEAERHMFQGTPEPTPFPAAQEAA